MRNLTHHVPPLDYLSMLCCLLACLYGCYTWLIIIREEIKVRVPDLRFWDGACVSLGEFLPPL
jgi:hypothetical protein